MTYYELMSDCGCNDFGEPRPTKEKKSLSCCYVNDDDDLLYWVGKWDYVW